RCRRGGAESSVEVGDGLTVARVGALVLLVHLLVVRVDAGYLPVVRVDLSLRPLLHLAVVLLDLPVVRIDSALVLAVDSVDLRPNLAFGFSLSGPQTRLDLCLADSGHGGLLSVRRPE